MCISGNHSHISRRGFTTMAMAGAGLTLLPRRAWALQTKPTALCVMCIDVNSVSRATDFLDVKLNLRGNYELLALAGSSLSAVAPAFPQTVPVFWNQVERVRSLPSIGKVVLLDHRHCGSYKATFGGYVEGGVEMDQHRGMVRLVRAEFARRNITLPIYAYLMPANPAEPTELIWN